MNQAMTRRLKSTHGFTLMELLVSLMVLSLLTVTLFSTGFANRNAFRQSAYEAECEMIFYALLEYQNEAIMDGCPRKVRIRKTEMQVFWTKDEVTHRDYIPVKTLTFTGDYMDLSGLVLHQHGTVSKAGTVYLNGFDGVVRKIVVQVGNGRIYLDEQ